MYLVDEDTGEGIPYAAACAGHYCCGHRELSLNKKGKKCMCKLP